MRFAYEHRSTPQAVRTKLDGAIDEALKIGGSQIKDARYGWNDDTLDFTFTVFGSALTGTVEVTGTEIIVDATIPLMFRPFEGRAKSRILRTLDEMFR